MSFQCTWRFSIAPGSSAADLSAETDVIMSELLSIERTDPLLRDASIGLDVAKREVEISLASEAQSFDEAVHHMTGSIRAAIHAAGGATPGWCNESEEWSAARGLILANGQLVAS